ncbi:hypothetical protein GWL_01020 [Herbaspirillum sp. GW103]|nr:hypothetical protein GWL_01020 [Herbaspirillum sp. GW103]
MEFGWEGIAIRNPALYRLAAPARHSGPPWPTVDPPARKKTRLGKEAGQDPCA